MNAPVDPAILARASLDDKYTLPQGRVFLTGLQSIARLAMLQRVRDERTGLNTAGYISGYRGSPLGGLDQTLARARTHLEKHHVKFQPGLNEDLAATAIWGTQQVGMFPGARYDGVFSMWYGKGPGVDRCGDVFKHANAAGTSRNGGVLVLAGDDHGAKSSTLPHQSEHIFKACCIPVLNPSNVQEYLDLGLHGFAMSRYSGCWIAFKCVTDVVESGASVDVDPERVAIRLPEDFTLPQGGLNIRWPDSFLEQESRLLDWKVYAALAYVRANQLDRIVWDSPQARLGIITTGKSYGDTMQALADLGIDEDAARRIGLRVYKVAMSWPLEPQGARRFARGLEEILVIEEKRQLIEYQIKEELYAWEPGAQAPRVVGKFDDNGEWSRADGKPAGTWLLPAHYEHSPALVAQAIASRLARLGMDRLLGSAFRERLAFLEFKEKALARPRVTALRQPYFCSGCPHNTSTRVPEGSRATAGIGCHFMAVWMNRSTATFTHMGAEGAPWIGQAPFTEEKHIFANLGDGTYYHSGLLAIRAAVAAKVTMTYKILYNDAVAMTGGQMHDGPLDPAIISRQIAAEGVQPIVVVTDEPQKYPAGTAWAANVSIRHRDQLDAVQRELRELPGVSAIIYDQTCASEKRRRRKRNEYPDPARRALINEMVCEGCGDCSTKSNCLSVEPLETEFGRKRKINQSTCNKDFSCVNGFCPSFITVEGGQLRKGRVKARRDVADVFPGLEEIAPPELAAPYGILVNGIGGTGVITIGQILAMAAHLEGKGVSVLDMSGLAQKGGPVMSHVRLATRPGELHATRISTGEANLIIGCDLVVTASSEALSKMSPAKSRAAVNATTAPTAEFVRNPNWQLPGSDLLHDVKEACGADHVAFVPATEIAASLMGDSIATNMFMLGYCWQKGWVPLARASLERAIELNGVQVEFNLGSFLWGRRAAVDVERVQRIATPAEVIPIERHLSRNLDEVIERRVAHLTAYQDAAYAARYRALVDRVRAAEQERVGSTKLAEAVARNCAKLMAYKDEYEVARLHADPAFVNSIREQFEGDYKLVYHLAPPLLAKADPQTGEPKKMQFGPWMLTALRVLAKFKGLRGGALDLFGHTEERRTERALIAEYEQTVQALLRDLSRDNHALALEIASLPDLIRGYGHIKAKSIADARAKRDALLARWPAVTAGATARAA
ncbi:MAG: indolepyruvate ferredoxin oxidoreductase [Betaproteobacteria bacterium RIFCSPLOWO2_12_FULL_67_28]|nr:MAG: indolepyruvate ferredoxin oxidoreductase [Betaproteobacteria bacterium RIFCSPLOWO2_12_FULL_67_28]